MQLQWAVRERTGLAWKDDSATHQLLFSLLQAAYHEMKLEWRKCTNDAGSEGKYVIGNRQELEGDTAWHVAKHASQDEKSGNDTKRRYVPDAGQMRSLCKGFLQFEGSNDVGSRERQTDLTASARQ